MRETRCVLTIAAVATTTFSADEEVFTGWNGPMENDKIMGKKPHPGKDRTSGYFGIAEHDDLVSYRNSRIKQL